MTATALGLLLGLEREWSHREGPPQTAGSRTFALLGLGGAVAASLHPWAVAGGVLAAGVILGAGYRPRSEAGHGPTTEVAAILAFLLGALAWRNAGIAAALAVIAVVLLASKERLHHFARDVVTQEEVEDALKFLVVAFVVLPVLPDREVGPYGVLNPERIWLLVVAVTGVGWAGYLAVRALGARRGLLLAGFAGGFVSASATTAALARAAALAPARRRAALGGVLLASLATLVQLAAVTALASGKVLQAMWPGLVAGAAVILVEVGLLYRRGGAEPDNGEDSESTAARPFALWPAVVLAVLLTGVLVLTRWVVDTVGSSAAVAVAGVAGFADVHAPALAAATLAGQGDLHVSTALAAIAVALGANTVTKVVLAWTAGGTGFGRRFTALIALPAAAVAVGLMLAG